MAGWLLLYYKLPTEPSASRVYIWRKLKRLGAIHHQGAVWALPDTARTREQFQWLWAEIAEMGGEAALWIAQPALEGQDADLIQQFTQEVDRSYEELCQALESHETNPDLDLEALSRQYQRIQSQDYFHSPTGQKVREAFLVARGAKVRGARK